MTHKRLSNLCVISLAASIVCLPFSGEAQPPRERGRDSDRRGAPPRFELGQVFPPLLEDELELTADQEKQLDIIKKDLKAKLERLLTEEQKQKIESFRTRPPSGQRPGAGPRDPESADANGPPLRDPERVTRGNDRRNRASGDSATPKDGNGTSDVKLKTLPNGVSRVPVTFSGGHETDPRDHGRPVVLIAAALGVTPEVFRDAFSKVRPARGGSEPEPAQVRQNKAVLMEALGKHGITNDELDKVSNYYRYPPGRKSLWTNKAAVANALIRDGSIIGYEIVDGGSGYSSTPTVSVPNFKGAIAKVELAYGKEMSTNGHVSEVTASQP